jgi:hypothetical protein
MALRITASTLLTKHSLEVHSKGVTFNESSGFGNVRKFSFAQIELILMSPSQTLSFQVGREVFSIPTKPDNKTHQQVIQALLQEVRRNAPRA